MDPITPSSNNPTKLISLTNLSEYTNHVERKGVSLTYAQYEALPEAQKNNGTTYYITDGEVAPVALNSLIFTLRQTLEAGQTSLVFSSPNLHSTSLIEIFFPSTTEEGVDYETFTQLTENSFSLTFPGYSSDVQVVALVFNV